jgi:DNA processing protein
MNIYFVTYISKCYEMDEDELLYALALKRVNGVGDVIAKRLIDVCGSPKAIFKERYKVLEKINGVGNVLLKNLCNSSCLFDAEKELKIIQKNGIKPLYFLDSAYPKYLKHCIDGPFLFFQDGSFSFENRNIISVVGTRNMTNYGRDFCYEFISGLKDFNPTIVSGFAYGIDICAHRAALENDLKTIGVLAHGFGSIYPNAHKKYMYEVYKKGGFLTEFWYHDGPYKESFLKRNRIVAGISEATVVIESASRGGSLSTATIANSYARDVFAVPGRNTDRYSMGCNNLIKNNKAALITSASDFVQMLGWKHGCENKIVQPELFVSLSEQEQKIVDYLNLNKKQVIDLIAIDCGILVHKTASLMFQLEMKGFVRPLPGKFFELV